MPKLRVKNAGTGEWDIIHPETNLDQLTDISIAGKNIAKLAAAPAGTTKFVKIDSSGNAILETGSGMYAIIGAAPASHGHVIADVTGLQTALNNKADLSGGKILSTQVPDWLVGGIKIKGTIAANTTIGSAWAAANGITQDETSKGYFFVVTASTVDLGFDANYILASFDEGESSTNSATLEQGDYLVFRGYTAPNYVFDIINNRYQLAEVSQRGIVSLSQGNKTTRTSLDDGSGVRGTKVIDEYALRNVMKSIYVQETQPTGLAGDLWIDTSTS